MCSDSRQCLELVEKAEQLGRILMVGHVFLYNAGIRALKDRMLGGTLGPVRYLHATRTNLGPIRQDVGAAMDLASHDVSIFGYLLDALPESVSARGQCWLNPDVEDVAFMSFRYPDKILANAHVSWMDPHKIRRITVVGEDAMALWDDNSPTAPLTLHDKSVERDMDYENFGEFRLRTHEGDITIPKVKLGEPLREQTAHFLDSVERREKPLSDGRNGLEVVAILEAVQKSMQRDGAPVPVEIPR
jgi:predicted dehydrogenase